MRVLSVLEQSHAAGGALECSTSSSSVSCWDSERGMSASIWTTLNQDQSTTFSFMFNNNGNVTYASVNSAEQMGKLLVSGAVGATVIGLGGGAVLAGALGMAASYGYSQLWNYDFS